MLVHIFGALSATEMILCYDGWNLVVIACNGLLVTRLVNLCHCVAHRDRLAPRGRKVHTLAALRGSTAIGR